MRFRSGPRAAVGRWLAHGAIFVVSSAVGGAAPCFAISINPTFDASIANDPDAATIEDTINAAIGQFENLISDPVSVSILFKETNSGLGQNETRYRTVS